MNWSVVSDCLKLAGPSGCGKTQFCCQLSVVASLPAEVGGLDGRTLYVDTENAASPTRCAAHLVSTVLVQIYLSLPLQPLLYYHYYHYYCLYYYHHY